MSVVGGDNEEDWKTLWKLCYHLLLWVNTFKSTNGFPIISIFKVILVFTSSTSVHYICWSCWSRANALTTSNNKLPLQRRMWSASGIHGRKIIRVGMYLMSLDYQLPLLHYQIRSNLIPFMSFLLVGNIYCIDCESIEVCS